MIVQPFHRHRWVKMYAVLSAEYSLEAEIAKSLDLDQTTPYRAVWSGSKLLASNSWYKQKYVAVDNMQ